MTKKDNSLQKKLTYAEHFKATSESNKAGTRSGYISGWIEGQRAMKEACLAVLRMHTADINYMIDHHDAWMDAIREDHPLSASWGVKEVFKHVFALPFIEPDYNGEWSDCKPTDRYKRPQQPHPKKRRRG